MLYCRDHNTCEYHNCQETVIQVESNLQIDSNSLGGRPFIITLIIVYLRPLKTTSFTKGKLLNLLFEAKVGKLFHYLETLCSVLKIFNTLYL